AEVLDALALGGGGRDAAALGAIRLRQIDEVLAGISVLGEHRRLAELLAHAYVERARQRLELVAGVVDVELRRDLHALRAEQPRQRVADGGGAGVVAVLGLARAPPRALVGRRQARLRERGPQPVGQRLRQSHRVSGYSSAPRRGEEKAGRLQRRARVARCERRARRSRPRVSATRTPYASGATRSKRRGSPPRPSTSANRSHAVVDAHPGNRRTPPRSRGPPLQFTGDSA